MRHLIALALVVVPLALSGCGKKADEAAPATPPAQTDAAPAAVDPGASGPAAIAAAVTSEQRLAGDQDQDSWRKPAEVLTFLELRPGMRVLDYFAGGGYYTELIARTVGPQGHVIAYNNDSYLKYAGDAPAKRYADNRLANVAQLTTAPENAPFEPASLDAALFVNSFHDLHWRSKDGSWPITDPVAALARVVPALKPGAVVVVVDHVAATGADPAVSVDAQHRIDPAVIKRDFEAAGLTFEKENPLFRNPADDHEKPVFDASIRHHTDQVMYRFRKP